MAIILSRKCGHNTRRDIRLEIIRIRESNSMIRQCQNWKTFRNALPTH